MRRRADWLAWNHKPQKTKPLLWEWKEEFSKNCISEKKSNWACSQDSEIHQVRQNQQQHPEKAVGKSYLRLQDWTVSLESQELAEAFYHHQHHHCYCPLLLLPRLLLRWPGSSGTDWEWGQGAPWFGEGQNSGVGRLNGRWVPEVLTCCVVTENNRTEKYDGLGVAKKLVLLPWSEWIVLQGRLSQNLTCVYHLKIFSYSF